MNYATVYGPNDLTGIILIEPTLDGDEGQCSGVKRAIKFI